MRPLLALTLIVSSPALAANPPLCALPAPLAVADHPVQSSPINQPTPPAQPASRAPTRSALPEALAGIPFVQHVAASGAVISDLGVSHGLQSFVARSGDQFRIFQLTPDHQAAVAGAMTDLTSTQLEVIASGDVTQLGSEHGLAGIFVRNGPQFQVFYVTPDKQRVIPGVMWDITGNSLTREQVKNIPGAIPTVIVSDGASVNTTDASASVSALPLVRKASFGTVGPASAPHLWMLIDPQCIYSVRAYQMLQPYVSSGKLRLSVIPLSVLDYEDHGQSTKSALALLSKPVGEMVSDWQTGNEGGIPSSQAAGRLRENMAVAHAIQLHGTPTLVWRKPDGSEGRIDGIPGNVDALIASIGS